MNCPGCEGKNRDDARFCKFCGADLLLRCRTCGEILDEDALFCDSCGTPVGEDAEPAAAARKVVTVLFADLTGSTALEERMDAESVRSVLDRFYAAMRAEVERHGGRVVKFTGDGAMAAFGVPEVHEDDAARAVDAALAMREELEELASDLGLDVSLKVGINTGEVVVSASDADVVGDAVNVASRLEGAATAGEILVGEETWRLTRGTSRYEPVPPLTLKGKSEPVPAYRLLSVDERTADSAAAPFVGREPELGRLIAAFEDAVESKSARLVTIIGSPGLGKTRLARELMSELSDTARVRETRCDPAGTTFAPIADAIREASGLSETDTEEQVLATLAARLPEDDPDRERIAARAAAILGVGQPGSTEETFWAIRRLIEAAAATQPVVLVLDDLHWAEPLLFDLIEHLAEWINDAPVLLVGTGRPELRDKRPSLVEGGRASAVISLEGLDRRATAQLALNLLGAEELPAELLAKIPESTEGNPLFVRELVRMLVDDGVLLRTPEGWSVTVDVDAIQVPPTIQSLLSARVDRLRNDERTVIELASVIGKEFYRGALYELAPSGVKDLVDGCLESLRRKELVEPVGTYWIDEPVYRFHHVLIRDAAYRRVLKESRAELHQRVASWLEAKTTGALGEHDELIGFHLEQAHAYKHQLGRADDELGRRAAALLGTAARRALDYDDLPAAATLSGRALGCLPMDDPSHPDLLIVRCEALLSMGEVSQGALAVADFDAVATTERLKAWATCFNGQLSNFNTPERLHETEALVAAAASELGVLGDQAGAAKAHTVHASTLSGLGQFGECERVLDLALNAARSAEDRRRITATLGSAPHAALWGPNPVSRAGGRCLDIIRLLRITTGSKAVEVASLRCQAVLEAFRGRDEAARRMLGSAKRQLTELGLDLDLHETEQFLGIAELVSGDFVAAETHLKIAHDGFLAAGVDSLAAQCAALLASAHLALGEYEAAELLALEAENLAGQDLKASIAWRAVKAELLARRGETDEAKRLAEAAVELAAPTDALIDHGNACRSLAVVLRAAGDADGARRAEERALALFERKGATALLDVGSLQPLAATPAEQKPVPTSAAGALENRCSRVAALLGHHFNNREFEASFELYAADATHEDRRPGVQGLVSGRSSTIDQMRVIADIGAKLASTVLATRGETLCLSLETWGPMDDRARAYEVTNLGLWEINSEGQFKAHVAFEPDDIDAAFAELDERFASGEGAPHAALIRTDTAFIRAMNERDWARMRELCSSDARFVDRSPAGRGEMTIEQYIASFEGLVDLTDGLRTRAVAVHALADGLNLSEVHNRGTSLDGGYVSVDYLVLAIHADALIFRIELFPAEQLEQAVARFGELRGGRETELANDCTRAVRYWSDAFNARDFDAVAAQCASNIVYDDRRPLFRRRVVGREEQIKIMRQVAYELAANTSPTFESTRGQHLCLMRQHWHPADEKRGGFEYELLAVVELNDDGLIAANVYFEPEDVDGAISELESRYAARTGSEEAAASGRVRALSNQCTRVLERLRAIFETQDWTTFATIFTDEFVGSDLRPGLQSEVTGPDGAVSYMRGVYEVGGVYMNVDPIAIRGERLSVARFTHRGEHDVFEVSVVCLYEIDDSQRVTSWAVFDQADEGEALIALDERYATGEGRAYAQSIDFSMRFMRALNSMDMAALRELVLEDCVFVDHRPASFGELSGREYIESLAAISDLVAEIRYTIRRYIALTNHSELIELVGEGATAEGAPFRQSFFGLSAHTERSASRIEMFDEDHMDEAIARFEELEGLARSGGPPDNGAVRFWRRFQAAFESRDWKSVETVFSDDYVWEDQRVGMTLVVQGPQEILANARAMADVGVRHMNFDVIATRGERLALARYIAEGEGDSAFEVEVLSIGEIDEDGRACWSRSFDQDDLDAAFAALDERYIAGEGSPFADEVRFMTEAVRIFNRREWDVYRSLLVDDFVYVDHQAASLGEIHGADQYMVALRALMDMLPNGRLDVVSTVAVKRYCGIIEALGQGATPDGFVVEQHHYYLAQIRDGKWARCEIFPLDKLDSALARFDELGSPPSHAPDNLAVRSMNRSSDCIERHDLEGARALATEDSVFEDRRAGLQSLSVGLDSAIENIKAAIDLGVTRVVRVPLATRGDRTALTRVRFEAERGADSFDVEALFVNEVNEEGRHTWSCMFDASDLDAAFAELDRRYLAGDEPTQLDRIGYVAVDAYNARDWETYGSLLGDDFVYVDHHAAGSGAVEGREKMIETVQALIDLVSDLHLAVRATLRREKDSVLSWVWDYGTDSNGNRVEFDYLFLIVYRDGLMTRLENFPPEQLEEAIARFEAPSSEPTGAQLENTCMANMERLFAAVVKARWDEVASLLHDDVVSEDRRTGLRSVITGREAVIESFRVIADLGPFEIDINRIAIRGDRLALSRRSIRTPEGDAPLEVSWLAVDEADELGRGIASVAFDPDDLDAAFAELEERWIAGEGAAFVDTWRPVRALLDAYNERDWETLRLQLADDAVFTDHRPASLGVLTPDQWMQSLHVHVDLAPDTHFVIPSIPYIDHGVVLWESLAKGSSRDGGEVEFAFFNLAQVRQGLIVRYEWFPLPAIDAALARAREIATEPSPTDLVLENAATRATERFSDAFVRRDWASLAEVFADDLVRDDRRPGIGGIAGKDSVVEAWKAMAELGYDDVRFETLAIRGTRLALSRALVTGEHYFENEVLVVFEADDEGHGKRIVYFESDQHDAAIDELNDQWIAGEASECAEILRPGTRTIDLINAQEWKALEEFFDPDFVFVDHRPISAAELRGVRPFLELIKGLAELVPDVRYDVIDVPRIGRDALISRVAAHGTNAEGGRVDFTYLQVHQFVGDKQLRLERFDLDQYDDALARFEELSHSESSDLTNYATRWQAEIQELSQRQDWTTLAERISPDAVYVDNRRGLGFRGEGREKLVEFVKASWPADADRMTMEYSVLAVRGDLLVLQRNLATMRDGYEVELLGVFEFNRYGLQTYCGFFDSDDLVAAFAELDRRYIAQGELTEGVRNALESFAAYNARDWDLWESKVAPEIVYVDHAPASIGELHGRSEYLRHVQRLIALAPDLQINLVQQVRQSPGVVLGVAHSVGTDEHGGRIEREHLGIMVVENGVFVRVEAFPPEQRDEAIVRYEELAGADDLPSLENACTRTWEQLSEAFAEKRWDVHRQRVSESVVMEDRRAGLRNTHAGVDAWMETARIISGLSPEFTSDLVAIRGDRLALTRDTYREPTEQEGAFEVESLTLLEVDSDAQLVLFISFDPEDLDAAFAELDERYLSSGDAAEDERVALSMIHAYNDRDWDRCRSVVEGFVNIDHRPASKGTVVNTDEYLQGVFALVAFVPDSRLRLIQVYVGEPGWGGVGHVRWTGTNDLGGEVESDYAAVVLVGDGRITRLENYAIEQLDAALARFDELRTEI